MMKFSSEELEVIGRILRAHGDDCRNEWSEYVSEEAKPAILREADVCGVVFEKCVAELRLRGVDVPIAK